MGEIIVKVGKMPGVLTEVALGAGATVANALEAAGLSADGMDIRVSGNTATLETALTNGSIVILAAKIKGN